MDEIYVVRPTPGATNPDDWECAHLDPMLVFRCDEANCLAVREELMVAYNDAIALDPQADAYQVFLIYLGM